MSAERLHQAAELLRVRAQEATPGRWFADDCYSTITAEPFKSACEAYDRSYADNGRHEPDPFVIPEADGGGAHFGNLSYIALMATPVALAVADWLGWMASAACPSETSDEFSAEDYALAVADAILGGEL